MGSRLRGNDTVVCDASQAPQPLCCETRVGDILRQSEQAARKAVNAAQAREQFAKVALKPVGISSAEFRALPAEAIETFAQIVKIAGIQPA